MLSPRVLCLHTATAHIQPQLTVTIPNQIFNVMHRIYSSAGKMSIYPLVFNLHWLLDMHECDSRCNDSCERNQKHTIIIIDMWLNSVARYSGGAPVLLIASHKDEVVAGADLAKSNLELAMSNDMIKRANRIIGKHIKSMNVYQRKLLNLHLPEQPSLLHVLCHVVPCPVCVNASYGAAGGTPENDPFCWFYAVDSKSRDDDNASQPTDPVLKEVREKLDEIVRNDDRKVIGLDGKPTRYLDFKIPLKAVRMLGFLRAKHKKFCTLTEVNDAAEFFAFSTGEAKLLLSIFKQLGMVLYFPEVPGCDDFVVLDVQWLIDAVSCLIREEELHGSLLQDLLEEDPSEDQQVWHRTPSGVLWNENDIKRGWFSVGLLDHIWGHTSKYKKLGATKVQSAFLKAVLTHFHLVHQVRRHDELFFVVPALVPVAPPLATPPSLENSGQLPEMPASVGWELHRLRQRHGQALGVCDFEINFEDEDYFPDHLFERLVCAVATKISKEVSDKAVRVSVDFYRHEATFAFNEHYIHATKHLLNMHVYSINSGAGNYTTSQYSLNVFRECVDDLVQGNVPYTLKLGYVDNDHYAYATDMETDLAASAILKIWHGEPDVTNPDKKWKKQVNT